MAVLFDTLKLSRRLEQAGFTRDQAIGAAEALSDAITGDLATKADIAEVRGEIAALRAEMGALGTQLHSEIATLRADLTGLGSELRGEMATLAAELRTEIASVRTEFRTEIASVRTEIAALRTSTAQWIIGAVFVNIVTISGAMFAVWQLAAHH
jgi:uncharacterized protein involved in exopolysaccharide biosynthesis